LADKAGGDPTDVAAALDMLLTDAALGVSRRFRPVRSMMTIGGRLAVRPVMAARRGIELAGQLGQIAIGTSPLVPDPRDRRFADVAWTRNPFLRRAVQGYLAVARTAETVVHDVDLRGTAGERVSFTVTNLVEAAAPSNNMLLNPTAVKEFIDTGGASAARGLRSFVSDMSTRPRVPRMVEPDAFAVGRDLGISPGSVVRREPLYELIQFVPSTAEVYGTPLLIVPPTINKYYILDISPGRSLIEFLVSQGHQVFTISWRNPDARFRDSGFDAYGQAVVEALATVRTIANSVHANVMAACSGGIITSMVMAHLAAGGDRQVNSLTLLVTVLDQTPIGAAALIDERSAEVAVRLSQRQGYLDGNSLAEVFAWLRPNDLIWNYWVNNYLLGRKPAPFDILYWNADTTRMPARLHQDFLHTAMANALVTADQTTMLGTPVDLGKVDVDSYVVAGVADHLCPWQSCYQSTQLLGGASRFVLSTSGHIAALVNPADNVKASFQAGDLPGPDPDAWGRVVDRSTGSWWLDYAEWLSTRSGRRKSAPNTLGRREFVPREPAPGTYVFEK
jgi:polyhydroxyalkanoate synthase